MGRMRHARSLAAALAAALIALSAEASATTPKEKAEAKALVAEARTASKQKRHADAAAALRKADGLDPNPQTKLDLARALVELRQLVEASQTLNAIIAGSSASPGAKKVVAAARKLLSGVEPRVPWIKISVIGPERSQTSTTIDGKEVDAAEEIPFDPGDHTVAAEAEGYESAEKRVSLGEGKHELVKLKLKKLAPEPKAEVEESSGGSALPAGIAFGVGGVGLAVGAIFGIMAFNETSRVEENCNNGVCPPSQEEPLSIAKTNGTVSTIGFIAGGVGVLTGVVLLVTTGSGEPAPSPAEGPDEVSVRPWIGVDQVGLRGRF